MKNKFKFLAMMLIGVVLSTNVWGASSNNGANLIPYCDGTAGSQKTVSGAGGKNAGTIVTDVLTYTSTCNQSLDGTKWIITTDKNIVFTLASGYKFDKVEIGVTTAAYTGTWTASSGTVSTYSTTTTISGCSGTILTLVNTSATEARVNSVKIYYLTETGPTVSSSESSLEFGSVDTESNKALTTKVSGSSLTGNITLSISGPNAGMFSVSPTSLTPTDGTVAATAVTVTYTPTATGSHSATLNIASAGATTKTVSLTGTGVAPKTKHNVNWHVGGEITTVRVAEGDPVVFPENPETPVSCGTKVFTGWTNAPYEDASVAPTYYKSATMATSDLNFYAVFADASGDPANFIKGSESSLTDGQIVVIHDNAGRALTTDGYTGSKIPGTDITPSNNKIPTTSITEGMKWTVGVVGDKYTFRQGSNYLMVGSFYLEFGTTQTQWKLESVSGGYYFENSGSYPYIGYSSYGYAYDIFAANTYAAILNVFIPNVSYANYVTSCATYNVTWKVNNATYEAGGSTTAPGGGKVSALPIAPEPTGGCTDATFMGWTASTTTNFGNTPPSDLFKDVEHAPAVTGDVTYHAVFADENE
ncbi:MAG: hypothetical protein KBS69_03740 [Bacteroidales bacterium]|nr:hypothetical protein [Candidatus Colicola caccequi]